jgi:hypothetical protein
MVRDEQGKYWHFSAALAAAPAVLIGACGIKTPNVMVGEPVIADRSSEAVVLRFPLEASNDNANELNLPVVEYAMAIDGTMVYQGERSPEATLRRMGRQSFVIPVVVPVEAWAGREPQARYSLTGQVRYRPPGPLSETLFDLGVRRPRAAFKGEGVLPAE